MLYFSVLYIIKIYIIQLHGYLNYYNYYSLYIIYIIYTGYCLYYSVFGGPLPPYNSTKSQGKCRVNSKFNRYMW